MHQTIIYLLVYGHKVHVGFVKNIPVNLFHLCTEFNDCVMNHSFWVSDRDRWKLQNRLFAKLQKGLLLINLGTRWESVAASRFASLRSSQNPLHTEGRKQQNKYDNYAVSMHIFIRKPTISQNNYQFLFTYWNWLTTYTTMWMFGSNRSSVVGKLRINCHYQKLKV